MQRKFHNKLILVLFFVLTAAFLFPIFQDKVFFPGDLLYQWPPWSLSNSSVLKDVLPINNPLLGDPVTAFYPWFTYFSQAISSGSFPPLWNPLIMAGAPFLANWQSGALALENVVFYLFNTATALNIHVFLKVFLALSFTYLFLRKLKLSREASIFGGITYAFSAFFVVWLNWPQTRVAFWLPLVLLTLEHLFEKPDFKRSAFVSLAFAAAVFGGHPGTLVMSMMVVFVFSAFRIFSEKSDQFRRAFFALLGIVLGLGLSAIMLLPGYEMMKESYQYHQRGATDYLKLSLWPGNIVLLFFPRFYGHLMDGVWVGPANFNEISAYIGLLPLFLGFWALAFVKKLKRSWPFFALAFFAAALIYSIWPQSLLYKLPLVDMQATQRYIFVLSFSLAVLGAFGFDAFFNDHKKGKRLIIVSGLFLVALAITIFKLPPQVKIAIPGIKVFLILTFIPLAALFGAYLKNATKQLKWLFIGLLVVDVFVFGVKLNSYVAKEHAYPRTPVTDFINKDKSLKRTLPLVDTMLPNSLMPYGIADIRGRDALISARYANFAKLLNDKDSIPQMPNFILPNRIDSQLINFLNVKYMISEIPAGNTLPKRLISSNGFVEMYKGQVQAQTFKAKENNLAGVGLLVGNFKMVSNPASIRFKLLDKKGTVLREKTFKAAYLRDNSYYSIDFKPVSGSKNKRFTVQVDAPQMSKKNHVALYMSGFDQYPDGNHIANGKKQAGDLVFYIQYHKESKKFKPVFNYKSLTVFENKEVLPRAYAVPEPIVISNDKKALQELDEQKIDLKNQVILNKEPVYSGKEYAYKGNDQVKINSYKANSISITASLSDKKLIVVSDTYYPGWKAYVDGKEAPLYIANTAFRAIAVNKGKHKVKLVYAPASFRRGLQISFFSLLIVLGLVVWPLFNEKFKNKNEK